MYGDMHGQMGGEIGLDSVQSRQKIKKRVQG
jgi:hypothetical protein